MAEPTEKLLAEIRDLLAQAIERERIRSDARDARIAQAIRLQRYGAVLLAVVLVSLVWFLWGRM